MTSTDNGCISLNLIKGVTPKHHRLKNDTSANNRRRSKSLPKKKKKIHNKFSVVNNPNYVMRNKIEIQNAIEQRLRSKSRSKERS